VHISVPRRYPVIPSIDLSDGLAVKRVRGEPGTELLHTSPLRVLQEIMKYAPPIERLHVVDLDGARQGYLANIHVIERLIRICRNHGLEVEVGGGVRSVEDAEYLYSKGADIVLGSIVFKNPEVAARIIERVGPDHVYVALDIKQGRIAVSGWSELLDLADPVEHLARLGVKNVVYTVVDVEGTLSGPQVDTSLLQRLREKLRLRDLFYAGGVSSREDILKLVDLGFTGVIIGRAMYTLGIQALLV